MLISILARVIQRLTGSNPRLELTTVGDDFAVFFKRRMFSRAVVPVRLDGLQPDTRYRYRTRRFRTLARPSGKLLCTFATVNDLHIGETICGSVSGHPHLGPVFHNEPGQMPYAEMMSRGAVAEIASLNPDAVLVKGDITDAGARDDIEKFFSIWGTLGEKLLMVLGNHDVHSGRPIEAPQMVSIDLPGATLALIDTTLDRKAEGRVSAKQLQWLEQLAQRADRPVLVFGHHHIWVPGKKHRFEFSINCGVSDCEGEHNAVPTPEGKPYFGINPDDSVKLIELFHRHKCFLGYFAGHTHRNRVVYLDELPGVPFAQIACVKDFPGAWAEYRVYEGGVQQIMHRVSAPQCLRWTQKTRAMFVGFYSKLALGRITERCFTIVPRT